METKRNRGFTLVEILIVVVILGILAAIVIPQFSDAATEANEANLVSNLQTMRSQIALYKIQHIDTPPDCTSEVTFAVDMVPTYLQAVPINPFTTTATVLQGNNGGLGGAPGSDLSAWYFNTDEDIIYANDNDSTPGGVAHSAL